jgi:CRP-like cAMP-binding protein
VEGLLSIAQRSPRRSFAAGEVVLVDGGAVEGLYVLMEGALRVEKAGVAITTISQPGACVGEISLLLGVPPTADVVATEPSVVAVIDDAPALLDEGSLTLALAQLLAARLQVMTTYLADLKHQYADHDGGLGMIDVVLGTLMQGPGPRSELRSERDPDPEY